VVVGTLDLGGGKPFTSTEVTLEIRKPDAPVEQRKMTSDGRGAARFTGLADLPPGTTLVAEATLHGELKRSDPFSLDGQEHGVAVVLAVSSGASADAMGRPQRRPLQTPRAVPTIAPRHRAHDRVRTPTTNRRRRAGHGRQARRHRHARSLHRRGRAGRRRLRRGHRARRRQPLPRRGHPR
jgi:hypothetical protein